jgi:hypothetical protein
MTDKELRKLTRAELLELLLVQSKEIDRLNAELAQLQTQMQQREINLTHAGSIAEAALQLNGIFEAAQAAADQYLENIKRPVADTETRCRQMMEETQQKCDELLKNTRLRTSQVWEVIRQEIYNPRLDYTQWQKIADYIDKQLKLK